MQKERIKILHCQSKFSLQFLKDNITMISFDKNKHRRQPQSAISKNPPPGGQIQNDNAREI